MNSLFHFKAKIPPQEPLKAIQGRYKAHYRIKVVVSTLIFQETAAFPLFGRIIDTQIFSAYYLTELPPSLTHKRRLTYNTGAKKLS